MIRLHEKYGPVLRIAPDELSYASAEAWQDIYAHHRLRRLLEIPLSERALLTQEPIITGYVDHFIQRLKENAAHREDPNRVLNLVDWVTFVCFDVLGDLAFGESFQCLEQGEAHWWINDIQQGVKAAFKLKSIERFIPGFFPAFMAVFKFVGAAMAKDPEENFMFCARKARERLARSTDRPDFTNKTLPQMTNDEIESNAQTLVNAGTEPVATAICGIFFHLVSQPDSLLRAVTEIRSAFNSESDITISTTQQRLPYLRAIINEGMRMYPPAPGTFPRTTPAHGCRICSRHVPGGYSVGVNQSAIMRSSALWVQPNQFAPERWLGDSAFESDNLKAYQPFSFGPRACIGKR
ncbi:hypothetical protein SLS53_002440 [Cytospora paraplurivora]|uniref:Uncharacterized protein n=1 Tax=Cytospora paraplurivora TaxID=2898453 RepID=A0AAN9YJK0_9PEZI